MDTRSDGDIQGTKRNIISLHKKKDERIYSEETKNGVDTSHNLNTSDALNGLVSLSPSTTSVQDMEYRLQESEARYRSLVSATAQIVWTTDSTGYHAHNFAAWCAYTGLTLEEADGLKVIQAIHPNDREYVSKLWYHATQTKQTYEAEYRLRRHDGVYRVFNSRAVPVFEPDGTVREWVGINTDITERKQLEEHLHQSEMRFRHMFEQASIGMVFATLPEGHLIQANQCFCDMIGYTREELLNQPALYLTHPDDAPHTAEALEQLIHGVQSCTFEKRYIRKDKSILWVNITMSAIHDTLDTSPHYLAVIEDITGRKHVQEEAMRQETEHRHLEHRTHVALEGLLSMAEAFIQLPEDTVDMRVIGRLLANVTCDILDCQRVGILVIEPVTERIHPIGVAGLAPEQESMWWREQEQQETTLQDSQQQSPELFARLQNNEVVIIDMSQPPFSDTPNPYNVKVMLVAPMYIHERLTGFLTLDYGETGHTYTPNEVSLASAVGKLLALVVERQHLLTERAEAQGREIALREANRRMEEFLGIASHELRTPLTTIKANVQLAKRRLHSLMSDETLSVSQVEKLLPPQDMLTRAERQTTVLNRLVGDLIDISRIQTDKLQVHLRQKYTNLTALLIETIEEQRKAYPHRVINVSVAGETAQQPLFVTADPDRIAQVITNYINNALKYSLANKPVDVSLERIPQSATSEIDMVRVSVRDEGPGLSCEEQQRIWECFYQSHEVKVLSGSGVGLGLGLYISQTIIERHNGQIGVDSTPGDGSTFWFTLPLES
ncbi:MAG TPA: hypothetical protein DHW02_18765 [Ktedonobacter sp.]|nr:hypothetical protein [Ktedonobacter sp.]